jgi:hypothetical protein
LWPEARADSVTSSTGTVICPQTIPRTGGVLHMALHKPGLPLSGEHSLPDGYTTISRCRRCGIVIGYGDRCELCIDRRVPVEDAPGEYRGRHHSEWAATVDELVIQGDDDEAEFILFRLIDATAAEATLRGVPPFERHFRRLAQIARRRCDTKLEAKIVARYEECARQARGTGERATG